LQRDPLGFFVRAREQHGDVVAMHFGSVKAHLLSHPDHARHVLQEHHRKYSKESPGFLKLRLVLGDGLLTSEGDFWRRQRRIAAPAFHHRHLAGFADTMTRATEDLYDRWDRAAEERTPIDVAQEMMRLTLRIVSETLLGADVSGDSDVIGRAVTHVIEDVNARISALIDLPLSVPTRRNRALVKAIAQLDAVVRRTIGKRRDGGAPSKPDLLEMLMAVKDEDTGETMTDQQLRDEVMTIFLAGHETTANAMSWAFYCLSLAPESDRRMADEIHGVLGERSFTLTDMPRLAYTQRVIKESMRLYPPAWIIGRMTEEADVIDGFALPKGGVVLMAPYVTHRHPDFWDDPLGFDPERFLPALEASRPRFAYYPFGGGPRVCIGNSFAMLEAVALLATLAKRYRLDLVPGHPVVPEPLITLRPKHGIKMLVRRR